MSITETVTEITTIDAANLAVAPADPTVDLPDGELEEVAGGTWPVVIAVGAWVAANYEEIKEGIVCEQ